MKFPVNQITVFVVFVTIIGASFYSCDDHIFTEFRTETDYQISDFDGQACYLLSRDTVIVDTTINGPDTTITETRQYLPVELTYITMEEWVNASDSLISALFDTLESDTTCVISNPEIQDTGYTLYEQKPGAPSTVVFFIGWDLNELNINTYIDIDLFTRSGDVISLKSSATDLETVAGCTQTFESTSGIISLSSIRARLTYSLPEGTYLVKCFFTKPEAVGNFRMVIL